jgi:hypothetical protein
MASILPFIPPGVFDDADTKAMGEAFDAACEALHAKDDPSVSFTLFHDVIAHRIVAAARDGERDVGRLRNIALAAFAKDTRGGE